VESAVEGLYSSRLIVAGNAKLVFAVKVTPVLRRSCNRSAIRLAMINAMPYLAVGKIKGQHLQQILLTA